MSCILWRPSNKIGWDKKICTLYLPPQITGDFQLTSDTLYYRKPILLDWIQIIEKHFPISLQEGRIKDWFEQPGYFWTLNRKVSKNFFHFLILLLRQPVEEVYEDGDRSDIINPLKYGDADDDPLVKFALATEDFHSTQGHGIGRLLKLMDNPDQIKQLRLATAVKQMYQSKLGINDAWTQGIRIGLDI